MALPVEKQIRYWGIAALVLFVLLWSLGNVLLPFVLGAAVAFVGGAVAFATLPPAAFAQADAVRHYDLPAGPLATTLP